MAKNPPDAMNVRPDQKSFGLLIFILSSEAAYAVFCLLEARQSVTRTLGLASFHPGPKTACADRGAPGPSADPHPRRCAARASAGAVGRAAPQSGHRLHSRPRRR